jgi:hypothetical protein
MASPTVTTSPPATDEATNHQFASYPPSEIPYNAEYQTEISRIMASEDAQTDIGIRVIPTSSSEIPKDGISIREQDILPSSLPKISKDELPLPLSDPRRIYASLVPGVKLTHPNGYYEGGPGLDPKADTFAKDYLSRNSDIRTAADLEAAKQRDIAASLEEAKQSAQRRLAAIEHNENTHKKIRALEAQHDMELKLQKRMAAEQKAKREAKEKKKEEKAGEKAGEKAAE